MLMNNETGGHRADIDDDDDFDDYDDDDDDDSDDYDDDDDESSDNVGDASVEINVEQLIAEVEGSGEICSARKREIRRRLEEIAEARSLDDTYAIDFDDD